MERRDGRQRDGLPAMAVEMLVRAVDARPGLAEAALANEAVRGLIAAHPGIYTEAGFRRGPIVRATVIGHPGEAAAIGLRKNWGGFRGFRPLRPQDPVDPRYVMYIFRDTSPYNRRVLQRKALKRRLTRPLRRWANEAYRSPRREFLARPPADAAAAIRQALGLDPIGFWRAARGNLELDLPAPMTQRTLFDEPGEAVVPGWRKCSGRVAGRRPPRESATARGGSMKQPSDLSREELEGVVRAVRDILWRDPITGRLGAGRSWDVQTIEWVSGVLKDARLKPDPSPPPASGDDVEEPAAMRAALEAFVRTIEATGGCIRPGPVIVGPPGEEVVEFEDDRPVPAGDEGWPDVADAYLLACRALGRESVIRDPDDEDDQDSGG